MLRATTDSLSLETSDAQLQKTKTLSTIKNEISNAITVFFQ